MRRSRFARSCRLLLLCLGLALPAGCGKGRDATPSGEGELTFEQVRDTAGLSAGEPIVQEFEAYRMDNGAMRVKGKARLPDGTRIQVAVKPKGEKYSVTMVQVTLQDGMFDSPPMLGGGRPLPEARYVFEISSQFIPEWQPANVLRETGDGKKLRGPGMTRTRIGTAMLWLTEEMTR